MFTLSTLALAVCLIAGTTVKYTLAFAGAGFFIEGIVIFTMGYYQQPERVLKVSLMPFLMSFVLFFVSCLL